ncbi:MAG: TetR/AcrR family transcriptional regulator [Anaerolineae bacterium]|jgi:AcrR family transcriptional regulator
MFANQDPIRQQLIEARRNQILDAAAKVFAEKGFHRATTKHIASEAGVAEGTIYNYFDSKGDLLIGIFMRLSAVENTSAELTEALTEDARGLLLAIARHRMALIEQNYETLQAVLPEMLVNAELRDQFYRQFAQPLAALLEQYVRARIESGDVRLLDAPLAVRSVQGMFIGLMILRFLGDGMLASHWDDVPEVLVHLLFEGLGPEEAA